MFNLQINELPYLRVKGFEDTIYCNQKIIEKVIHYRESPQDFSLPEKAKL